MRSIDSIEGIGDTYAQKFKKVGIWSVEGLLEAAGEKKGRQELSEATGISEKLLLKWINMADLCRVHGIGGQYAELLECAGVDTVKELAQRNPESLAAKIAEANEQRKVVRQVPGLKIVNSWVTQAKTLPRKVSY